MCICVRYIYFSRVSEKVCNENKKREIEPSIGKRRERHSTLTLTFSQRRVFDKSDCGVGMYVCTSQKESFSALPLPSTSICLLVIPAFLFGVIFQLKSSGSCIGMGPEETPRL
jgi:hypothetical protein